jgi:hypothetical protein
MLSWCERHGVGYMVGLAKNARLNGLAGPSLAEAKAGWERSGEKQRLFVDLRYGARSWTKQRRVIARLEHGPKGANPRYVVTNLEGQAQELYEQRWRTASRNASSTCSPTEPHATSGGPTSSA